MTKENLYQLHKEKWFNTASIDRKDLEPIVEDQKKIDEMVPPGPRFYIVVNLNTYQYEFIGKDQQLLCGYDNEKVKKGGIKFQTDHMHPEDGEIIVKEAYGKLTELFYTVPVKERKELMLQCNYRFKHKSGHYLHLMEQSWVIKLDDEGNPLLVLTQVYQMPMFDPFKINVLVKKLNKKKFKNVYSKVLPDDDTNIQLTNREKDVVKLIAAGYNSKEIAERLFISYNTVMTHRRNILKRLKFNSSSEVVAFAITHGII